MVEADPPPNTNDLVERVAREMFDAREVRRMASPHIKPANWVDHAEYYLDNARAAIAVTQAETDKRIAELEAALRLVDQECARAHNYRLPEQLGCNIKVIADAALKGSSNHGK